MPATRPIQTDHKSIQKDYKALTLFIWLDTSEEGGRCKSGAARRKRQIKAVAA
jgi:hypothetical protein